jgi:cation diffusion facilitator family transporter
MSASCCHHDHGHDHGHGAPSADPVYRRVLWAALFINGAMFAAEVVAGLLAGSVSLLADSVDFLGDAANYGVSLFVLGMSLRARASASLLKGASMGLFGVWVAGTAVMHALDGAVPEATVMGWVGFAALAANLLVTVLLFRFRTGDSNMRSVWLCSRNDAIGNVAVMLAAAGVFWTGTGWPDIAVAALMAALAISSSYQVLRQALGELKAPRALAAE